MNAISGQNAATAPAPEAETTQDEFQQLLDKAVSVEGEWQDKILDYVSEHYPTQATVSARTTSAEGLSEREAMRNDAVLKEMLQKADEAVAEADRKVGEALEAESAQTSPKVERVNKLLKDRDAVISVMAECRDEMEMHRALYKELVPQL